MTNTATYGSPAAVVLIVNDRLNRVAASAVWPENGSAASVTTSVTRARLTGLGIPVSELLTVNYSLLIALSLPPSAILTAQSESVDANAATTRVFTVMDSATASVWTITETPGQAAPAIMRTVAGNPVMSVSPSGVTSLWTYDGAGRQASFTDGRGNTTAYHDDAFNQMDWTEDALSNRTSYAYDTKGRVIAVTDALGNIVRTEYDDSDNITAQWGATYPVRYTYDAANRKTSMRTFRDEPGGAGAPPAAGGDLTRWLYDNATGLLTNKVYADGSSISYTHTPDGQPLRTTWARGEWKEHSYDALGQLTGITYSDGTPPVSFAYDRLGNMISVTDASGSRLFTHAPNGETLSETAQIGPQQYILHESRDTCCGHSSGYALSNTVGGVSALLTGMTQSHDAAGRISEVAVAGIPAPFRYGWQPGTDLQQTLAMPNGVTRETAYEPCRDLPAAVTHTNAGGTILTSRTFTRDAVSRLTDRAQYRLGDATNRLDAFGYNPRSELASAVLHTNVYGYVTDPIGNRLVSSVNGESTAYAADELNRYTAMSTSALSAPPREFILEFDADGNQALLRTTTGIWHVTYNAENRPVRFSGDDGTTVIDMAYDYMGRRFLYREIVNGTVIRHERYLYRGYLQIAALDMLNTAAVIHTIVWDPSKPTATRPLLLSTPEGWYTYGFDQVKNVTELLDASGGLAATYDYSPFGEITATTGTAAPLNPIRFSSEVYDPVLGLVQYNYRPYNPPDGRFFNRDPIEEAGGLNMYMIAGNASINLWDYLGKAAIVTAITTDTTSDDWAVWSEFFKNNPVPSGDMNIIAVVSSLADFLNLLSRTQQQYGEIRRINISGHGMSAGVGARTKKGAVDLSRLSEQQEKLIKGVLAKNAEIFVYSCNSASGIRFALSQKVADSLATCIHSKDGLCESGPDNGKYGNPSSNSVLAYFQRLSTGWKRFSPKAKSECDSDKESVDIKVIMEEKTK